uniref:Adenosylmethionine decarboxylase n=1 Tax=viral metagenome TaxID=1070528 RepID=A0A6C0ERF5_9ZZZZ
MFNDYESSGKHMICDFKGIQNNALLNDINKLNSLLKNVCSKNSFQILNEIEKEFSPIGCTIIFLLSESHISIHSFPEKKYISFDLYTCRQYENDNEYIKIYQYMLNELNASKDSTCKIIDRYF